MPGPERAPVAEDLPHTAGKSPRRITHLVVLVLLCLSVVPEVAGPALRLAARPIAGTATSGRWVPLDPPSTIVATGPNSRRGAGLKG